MESLVPIVKKSFTRCMGRDVFGRFYEIFIPSHPDIAPYFENTDIAAQKDLLKHGVHLAIRFASDDPLGKRGIDRIRRTHSRGRLDIKPFLYRYWKDKFLQALAECDPAFSEVERQAWSAVLQKAIDHIVAGYLE